MLERSDQILCKAQPITWSAWSYPNVLISVDARNRKRLSQFVDQGDRLFQQDHTGHSGVRLWTELDDLVADLDVSAGDGLLHTFHPDPGYVTPLPFAFFSSAMQMAS